MPYCFVVTATSGFRLICVTFVSVTEYRVCTYSRMLSSRPPVRHRTCITFLDSSNTNNKQEGRRRSHITWYSCWDWWEAAWQTVGENLWPFFLWPELVTPISDIWTGVQAGAVLLKYVCFYSILFVVSPSKTFINSSIFYMYTHYYEQIDVKTRSNLTRMQQRHFSTLKYLDWSD